LKEIAVMLAKKPSSANIAAARSLFDLAEPKRAPKKMVKAVKKVASKKK
jgi:hypothetical protein